VIAEGHYDYGIRLLLSCCKLDPCDLPYRRALRQAEKQKYHDNQHGVFLAWLRTLPARARPRGARRSGGHVRALSGGEEVLQHNPWCVATQLAMAAAAEALGLLDLARWLLEEARQKDRDHVAVNRALARLEEKRGNLSEAVALWERVRKA